MAKLIVDLPRDWEAKVTQSEKGQRIEIEPMFVSGTTLAPCLYLTSEGKGGMQRRVVIALNGKTGWPETRRVKSGGSECEFDLTPDKYRQERGSSDDDDDAESEN